MLAFDFGGAQHRCDCLPALHLLTPIPASDVVCGAAGRCCASLSHSCNTLAFPTTPLSPAASRELRQVCALARAGGFGHGNA
eukprot:1993945-Rhodomonas_salina.8